MVQGYHVACEATGPEHRGPHHCVAGCQDSRSTRSEPTARYRRLPTVYYRLLPAITALVRRRKLLVPLEQFRLSARERDLLAPDHHVLHTRRELERVARPNDDVGYLPGLERAVAIRNPEDLGRRQGHRLQRLIPRHTVGDRVPGLLAQVARVVRIGLEQRDFHTGLEQ